MGAALPRTFPAVGGQASSVAAPAFGRFAKTVVFKKWDSPDFFYNLILRLVNKPKSGAAVLVFSSMAICHDILSLKL